MVDFLFKKNCEFTGSIIKIWCENILWKIGEPPDFNFCAVFVDILKRLAYVKTSFWIAYCQKFISEDWYTTK